jgi:hypothetical protein
MDSFQELSIGCCHWMSDTTGYMEGYVGVRVGTHGTSKSGMSCLWQIREELGYWRQNDIPKAVLQSKTRQKAGEQVMGSRLTSGLAAG